MIIGGVKALDTMDSNFGLTGVTSGGGGGGSGGGGGGNPPPTRKPPAPKKVAGLKKQCSTKTQTISSKLTELKVLRNKVENAPLSLGPN